MGRPKKIKIDPDQPEWTCHACGVKYGSFRAGQCTWHSGICPVCGEKHALTEPRDFGYFLLGWKEKRDGEEA